MAVKLIWIDMDMSISRHVQLSLWTNVDEHIWTWTLQWIDIKI